MNRFDTIDYLMEGSEMQKKIHSILIRSQVMTVLKDFTPVLTGTYPLDLSIPGSDLDIICYVMDKERFISIIEKHYSLFEGYKIQLHNRNKQEIILVNFFMEGIEFEIYGQDVPVIQQNAYLHMINEYKFLSMYGEPFRRQVIDLKRNGMKTEPAFAYLLNLKGDPYEAMLKI